jgi:aromatic ring-cleaving dioxygenase
MKTIQPTYITFEQAKLFKVKNFREECSHYYMENNPIKLEESFNKNKNWDFNYANEYKVPSISFSAPEQWQVVEWLRVNHGIHIVIMPKQLPDNSVVYYIWKGKKATFKETFYNSPQEAYSAAFNYILNNLI